MQYFIAFFMLSGTAFSLFAALGILRMPDAYIRMHASTKAGTIGLGLIMISIMLYFQDLTVTSRGFGIIAFILMTAPIAAHLLGKSLLHSSYPMWQKSTLNDAD